MDGFYVLHARIILFIKKDIRILGIIKFYKIGVIGYFIKVKLRPLSQIVYDSYKVFLKKHVYSLKFFQRTVYINTIILGYKCKIKN
ncbi:hypothetical protein SDC9_203254 [bioreactor metagenome]|uniref:Uncharacterized protein n=1 Tax=bioreactor metagenome TaxID=1076179 RepID=A0A645IXE5_9ZZZZ